MARGGKVFRGIDDDQILHEAELLRKVQPLHERMLKSLEKREMIIFLFFILTLFMMLMPFFFFIFLPIMFIVTFSRRGNKLYNRLVFRMPGTAKEKGIKEDYSDPIPGTERRKFFNPQGIFYLGNTFEDKGNQELWVKGGDVLTHMLIFGTTGAGKTETLVSLSYNALAMGSGFFYIDPKAAPKLAVQIYTMARYTGRDHDFLVMSYSMQQKNKKTRYPRKVANTINPFSSGSSDALSQLLIALIPTSEGENAVFSNKAQSCIIALLKGLVDLRDKGYIDLSIRTVREHMDINKYVELALDPRLSPAAKEAVQGFLRSANWVGPDTPVAKQEAFQAQFGYAISYFSLAMANLTDTYGHIYLTENGEVDMFDVIRNRRVFVVLLPALEMAPEQLKSVGQITLSSVRNACSVGLGDKLVGKLETVLGALPVDSPTPFLSITDEYAAIPTPGYAEVLTQGRGLGIAAIVASQDYGGIKGGDEKGAKQIVSNTKIKLCMTLEDAEDTLELFNKIAGEAKISEADDYERNYGVTGGYIEGERVKVTGKSRLNIRDLQEQIEGEFHAIFKGGLVRGSSFYAAPPLKDHFQLRINEKLGVSLPSKEELDKRYGKIKEISKSINEKLKEDNVKVERIFNRKINSIKKVYDFLNNSEAFKKTNSVDKGIIELLLIIDALKENVEFPENNIHKEKETTEQEQEQIQKQEQAKLPSHIEKLKLRKEQNKKKAQEKKIQEIEKEKIDMSKGIKRKRKKEMSETIEGAISGAQIISSEEELEDTKEVIKMAEAKIHNKDEKESEKIASNTMEKIAKNITEYPGEPKPIKEEDVSSKKSIEEAADGLLDMLDD